MRSGRTYICSAAILGRDGVHYVGHRHHDAILAATEVKFGLGQVSNEDQGFIDEEGNFLNRKQAAARAIQCGQIEQLKWPAHGLFSEDLY